MKKRFKKGLLVTISVHAGGVVTEETGTVLMVNKQGVWLDNGYGNDPSGPYDPVTGVKDFGGFVGKQVIKPL